MIFLLVRVFPGPSVAVWAALLPDRVVSAKVGEDLASCSGDPRSVNLGRFNRALTGFVTEQRLEQVRPFSRRLPLAELGAVSMFFENDFVYVNVTGRPEHLEVLLSQQPSTHVPDGVAEGFVRACRSAGLALARRE